MSADYDKQSIIALFWIENRLIFVLKIGSFCRLTFDVRSAKPTTVQAWIRVVVQGGDL